MALPTSTFLPGVGGVEVGLHNIASGLVERGHRAVVVMPWRTYHALRSQTSSLPYAIAPFPPKLSVLLDHWPSLALWLSDLYYRRLKRRHAVDVWHGTMGYPTGVSLVHYAAPRGEPHLVRCAGEDIQIDRRIGYGMRLDPRRDRLIRRWLVKAQRLVATTRTMTQEYVELGVPQTNIARLANGVDVQRFQRSVDRRAVRRAHGIPEEDFMFLSVGRNHPKKNFRAAIEAAARLAKATGHAFSLVIVGKGVGELGAIAAGLGISDRVILLEEISAPSKEPAFELPSSALVDLYKSADAFVLPSIIESFGIVIVEAMAAGLPVVVFDAPGCRDVVRDGRDGLMVDLDDTDGLSRELARLLDDPELRARLREQSLVRAQDFSWDSVVARYIDLYREVVDEATPCGA